MLFPIILAALVIISAAFLLRQFWHRSLADDEAPSAPELMWPRRDDDRNDALKAA
jgi:hypothetical protein